MSDEPTTASGRRPRRRAFGPTPGAARRAALAVAVAGGLLPSADRAHAGDVPALASEVLAEGLFRPTWAAPIPGADDRLVVVQQDGRARLLIDDVLQPALFADLRDVVPDEPFTGLTGLAFDARFDPDDPASRWVYFMHPRGGADDADRIVIVRHRVNESLSAIESGSADEILVLPFASDAPSVSHLGGSLAFGPDGMLWISLGDGGDTGGELVDGVRSQSLAQPWGKILRIDVRSDAFPADDDFDFALPADNPFASDPPSSGPPALGPVPWNHAIWAFGLRNPYRTTIDPVAGDLWIADVGRIGREEVNVESIADGGGRNYGWDCREGSTCREVSTACDCLDAALADPVHEYAHSFGNCSISGGAVHRDCAIPELVGSYFFGDWCSRRIWSLRVEDGAVTELVDRTAELDLDTGPGFGGVYAICNDARGGVLILDASRIHRVVPRDGIVDENGDGVADSCECAADLTGDGFVDGRDLTVLLAGWGESGSAGDVTGDGRVSGADIVVLLGSWGPCRR